MVARLVDRVPSVAPERLLQELVPPPRFDAVRFETYHPGADQPTQAAALTTVRGFAEALAGSTGSWWRRRPAQAASQLPGIYLDGGFGVGKTHLLAALWRAAPGPKAYASFSELTHLVGALGFRPTVEALSRLRLLCIDEFELDDPGDTVLVSTLLGQLASAGVRLAATSNTLPGALGEGRFAADAFLREIQGLADRFTAVRIDGPDFRHRGAPTAPPPYDDAAVTALAGAAGTGATLDEFDGLLAHLGRLHPSRYGALLDDVRVVHLRGVHAVRDQNVALRLVVLGDRLYDARIPVVASGAPLDRLFPAELMAGGYRKKYARAVSRLVALAREASADVDAGRRLGNAGG